MAAFLLTPDNLSFLKSRLCDGGLVVRSAHLTEALAFGAGYRTHAAMLAFMKSANRKRPAVVNVQAERIAVRLSELGYSELGLISVDHIVRSFDLPDRIWVEFGSGDMSANEIWYRECQLRDIPNLRIERRRKYVKLDWDCISLNTKSDAHVSGERGAVMVKKMFATYQGIARRIPGKSEFFGSGFVGSVDKILPELAYEIADEFFTMLYDPICQLELAG